MLTKTYFQAFFVGKVILFAIKLRGTRNQSAIDK